jgi:hypothetical protein
MTRRPLPLRGRFWLTLLKLAALAFVALMVLIQIPELRYDFGPKTPVEITGEQELAPGRFQSPTFVSIGGEADFDHAFVYRRYGLQYTYFLIRPYGIRLVARTYERVDDDWKNITRFLGKLRPFRRQPFSYRIRDIYRERFDIRIPEGAYFLALYDVPKPSGWQIGAVIFSGLLWIFMVYMFFFFRRARRSASVLEQDQEHPAGDPPENQGP